MKKKILFLIFFLFFFLSNKSISQSIDNYSKNIIDYYFPFKNNKSTFVYLVNGKEKENGFKREIFYVKKKSSNGIMYETVERNSLDSISASIIENNLEISSNQISISNSIVVNALSPGEKETKFNPPKILLKLPKYDKIEKWKYSEASGETYEYTAELTRIIIDGAEKNVIKVYKKVFSNRKFLGWASLYYYYVEGIGLWKIQETDGTDFIILKELSFDLSNPDY